MRLLASCSNINSYGYILMPNKKDFDTDKAKEIFIHTFERCGCNINISCKAADITRRCFYYWLDDDKDFAEKVEDAKQGLIDFAESKLVEMMKVSQ